MKISSKKYFILAVAGAAILGFGIFMLLNIYFEKTEIIIASEDIKKNGMITEDNIAIVQYFRNSLPEGYITKKSEILGKTLTVERKEGDPLTKFVFEQNTDKKDLLQNLKDGEVMMALSIKNPEPLADEIKKGSRICIVSTEKEKEYNAQFSLSDDPSYTASLIDYKSFSLSENIMVIDGQIIIKNLEIINIGTAATKNSNTLLSSSNETTYIFLKCDIKEASVISRVTKSDDYRIFLEKS